jgi:hypothetical protein
MSLIGMMLFPVWLSPKNTVNAIVENLLPVLILESGN